MSTPSESTPTKPTTEDFKVPDEAVGTLLVHATDLQELSPQPSPKATVAAGSTPTTTSTTTILRRFTNQIQEAFQPLHDDNDDNKESGEDPSTWAFRHGGI